VKNGFERGFDITIERKGHFSYKNRENVYYAPRQEVETRRNLPIVSQYVLVLFK